MRARVAGLTLACVVAALVGSGISCSDRRADDSCYFVDDASNYLGPPYVGWCERAPDETSPLLDHCPAGECVDYFITCDEVPIGQACPSCSAEELDRKVLVALGAEYEARCPDTPHELIDFERGCMYEKSIPGSDMLKRCCYTATVVGECSLMGT